jgi:hypothetical protein
MTELSQVAFQIHSELCRSLPCLGDRTTPCWAANTISQVVAAGIIMPITRGLFIHRVSVLMCGYIINQSYDTSS